MIGVLFLDLNGMMFGANLTGNNIGERPKDPVPADVYEFDMETNDELRLIASSAKAWSNLRVTDMGTDKAVLLYKDVPFPVTADGQDAETVKALRVAFKNLAGAEPAKDVYVEALCVLVVELSRRNGFDRL